MDTATASRALIELSRNASSEEILGSVQRHGCAVLERYLDSDQTAALRGEALRLLEQEEKGSPTFLKSEGNRAARLSAANIAPSLYPGVANLFYSPSLQSVARQFFAPHPFSLTKVYIHQSQGRMDFNDFWHIDPSVSLKFYVYLTDTDRANGAFSYAVGSHREGFFRLMYYRQRGQARLPQAMPDEEIPPARVTVEAPAGTLIVFAAHGMHRGGEITSDRERLVMIAHCYYKTTRAASVFRKALLRSPLNLGKYSLCDDDHFNDRFKSTAKAVD